MGELAKAATAAQMAQSQSPSKAFEGLLRAAWPKIEAVMPSVMNPERMFQIALTCYKQNGKLASCDPTSVLSCLMKCSTLGLEPSEVDGLGRCYLIPRKGQCTFMLGYRGMIELMRRSGEIRGLQVRAVHEGDDFDYEFGTSSYLRHRPCDNPGSLTHVYAVVSLKSGEEYINVMTRAQVDERRKRSQASGNGPWATDYEAMALKTVVRDSSKWLPMSVELRDALDADGETPEIPAMPDENGEVQ